MELTDAILADAIAQVRSSCQEEMDQLYKVQLNLKGDVARLEGTVERMWGDYRRLLARVNELERSK